MRARARSMLESIFTIVFPVLMGIIYLRKDIFMNPGSSQGYDRVVSIAGHSITVLTILLSIISIILWICLYAEEFIKAKNLSIFKDNNTNFVRCVKGLNCNYLISGTGFLMILTAIALFLLFKQNHKPLPVTLAIVLSLFCLGFMIRFPIKDHSGDVPKEEVEYMLELAAGITNLLFAALTARAIDNFGTSNDASNEKNSAQLTVDGDFEWQLFFLFVGSLFGIFIMVLISVANTRSCSKKIWTFYCLLIIAVMANVLAGTLELLEGYAILEILPGLVYLLVYLWKVIFNDDQQLPQQQNGNPESQEPTEEDEDESNTKPVTLSFTNIAFAGLVAAVSFNDKDKEQKFKAFAGFASTGLVCAVIWRLLTHDTKKDPNIILVQRVGCGFTLVLLSLAVVTSGFIAWG